MPQTDLIIYETKDGSMKLPVNVKDETVWLPQADIAALFGVNVPAVSKHINNIFKDGELQKKATLSKMETVRKEGKRTVARSVDTFNLDMILSIGYRVNSKRATQFRIWANTILKQHLLKGFTLNRKRLRQAEPKELQEAVALIRKAMEVKQLTGDESKGLLKVITDYAHTWLLLDQFGKASLPSPKSERGKRYRLEEEEVLSIVRALKKDLQRRGQADGRFGTPRDSVLRDILSSLGEEKYSIEQTAAHLLYDLIRKHPFDDGNKRIAAFLFIVYLTKSEYLSGWDGERKFSDNALVALVLLVAESEENQKDLILKLIMNFVHG